MLDFFALIYGVLSLFTGAFFVSHVLQFQKYWQARSKEYSQATAFLSSDSCQNPILRAHLGSFNKCEDAEAILGRMPIITALHDVATDLSICGHGRCTCSLYGRHSESSQNCDWTGSACCYGHLGQF